jgi:hypothetical protein
MRDRSKTIASLRRLIERPGTPQEGETARRLLEMMGGKIGFHVLSMLLIILAAQWFTTAAGLMC